MKIYFDTEFTGLHQSTTLISLGCVAEDGRSFYAEFTDYARAQVGEWVQQHVLPNLLLGGLAEGGPPLLGGPVADLCVRAARALVTHHLEEWLASVARRSGADRLDFWGDSPAYDWVLLCELWGGALSLPSLVHYAPFDLATLLLARGLDPDISREQLAGLPANGQQHNALHDARVIKACCDKLAR